MEKIGSQGFLAAPVLKGGSIFISPVHASLPEVSQDLSFAICVKLSKKNRVVVQKRPYSAPPPHSCLSTGFGGATTHYNSYYRSA